jgi:beta-N-acetylhexosaminidase
MKDLSRLTLEEKVGQLFFLGFRGYTPDPEAQALLDAVRPGGLVISQRNIDSFDQIRDLAAGFAEGGEIPAFTAVAQEGGAVDRLKQLFGPLPALQEMADGGVTRVRVFARLIASELEALGLNTLLGPVLDLAAPGSVLHQRTLSVSPREVSRMAGAFIEEVSGRGIFACPKHFPGMGSAPRDPHFGLPRIDKARKLLLRDDLRPFQDLLPQVPMILVGHAHYPELMDARPAPASLSTRVVEGLLRRKLGFAGIVIADDMTMGAISSTGLTADRFLEAFEAGNDMMLFSETTPLVEKAHRTIVGAVKRSTALRARLDRSVERILTLKHSLQPAVRNPSQVRARVMRQIARLGRAIEPQRAPVAG